MNWKEINQRMPVLLVVVGVCLTPGLVNATTTPDLISTSTATTTSVTAASSSATSNQSNTQNTASTTATSTTAATSTAAENETAASSTATTSTDTASTTATTTIYSTLTGGSWNSVSTWEAGNIPTATSTVVIQGPITIHNTAHSGTTTITNTGSLQAGGTDFFARYLHVHGPLINHGSIHDGRLNIHAYNTIEHNGSWNSDTDLVLRGSFTTITGSSTIPAKAILNNAITLSDRFTIGGVLETNGHTVTAIDNPTITLNGGITGNLTINGSSTLVVQGRINVLNAPQTNLEFNGGTIGYYNPITVQEMTSRGYVTIGNSATITIRTFTNYGTITTAGTGFSARHLTVYGDMINHGSLPNSKLQVHVQGNITNHGTWTADNKTYLLFSGNSPHRYVQSSSLNLLSSQTPVTTTNSRSLNIHTTVRDNQPLYVRSQSVTDGGPYQPPVTINIQKETVTTPQDYFTFDLITDVTLPTEQTITIYAKDSNFSGPVGISSGHGKIYPRTVNMVDGEWTGTITFFEPFETQVLHVAGRGVSSGRRGSSNIFEVQDSTPRSSQLTGTVRMSNGLTPVVGTVVTAVDLRLGIYTDTTDATGRYEMAVPAGQYTISGANGTSTVKVGKNQVVIQDLVQFSACVTSNTPVLLVPGIEGSDRVGRSGWFPELYSHVPTWDSGELEIHDPLRQAGFGDLKNILLAQGYQMGCDLFSVPYDWSISVVDAAAQYLQPWIDHAKQVSGKTQVDVVAHSMGGLVTRSYIQGNDYGNDIRRFAMVGTPNQGSVQAYFSWEGGDPLQADRYGGSFFENVLVGAVGAANFQTNTLNENYKIKTGDKNDICYHTSLFIEAFDVILRPGTRPNACDNGKLREFLHTQAPAVGELYPTYPFLFSEDGQMVSPKYENKLLKALNGKSCESECGYNFRLFSDVEGISTKIFTGHEEVSLGHSDLSTPRFVFVKPHSGSVEYYQDGALLFVTQGIGDGTVLQSSVRADLGLGFIEKDSAHASLIVDYANEITNFITNN